MSSGSKQTALSVAILAGSLLFVASVRPERAPAQPPPPVHLAAPPVVEHPTVPPDPHVLRVCADPNNLPFANERGEGFENRIAEVVARDLGRTVKYYWQPQRRGFIRTTLKAGECDVVIGVPSSFDLTRVTRPYYRSAYYFVSKRARGLHVRSLDDPRLRRLRVGIEITGDDYDNPPAAQALAARHIIDNVHGYTVYGDYSTDHPSWGLMNALAHGDVDVAIAWGPLAGYVARQTHAAVEMHPVTPEVDMPFLPFVYDISMGVRREDQPLAAALDDAIERHGREIRSILADYGVPFADPGKGVQG
jgi:quinoprotein dehydrogenase-associated probable ABC transporter substrate-binding protein